MEVHDIAQLLQTITDRIVQLFAVDRGAVFLPSGDDRLELTAESVGGDTPRRASGAMARWAFRRGPNPDDLEPAPAVDRHRTYIPLRAGDRTLGIMEVGRKVDGSVLDASERGLLISFAAQAALAVARSRGEEQRQRLQVLEESDRLKSSLLNAVSHDLRTPLASIKASATALLLSDATWTPEESREFAETIVHESDRLNRLVGNLLDLSRIESGALRPVLEWYDLQEVVDAALASLRPYFGGRRILVDVDPAIGPVQLDFTRIESLIVNVLDNALKYTPANTSIEIRGWRGPGGVSLAVVDHGPGVPSAFRARVFERFFRAQEHGDRHPCAGLGLAIFRGVAEAHGGSVRLEETPGGGATVVLSLPAAADAAASLA